MGGHATHDEREARAIFPEEQFHHWGRRDPIGVYEECLLRLPGHQTGNVTRERLAELEREVLVEVEDAQRQAIESRADSPASPANEEARCYG